MEGLMHLDGCTLDQSNLDYGRKTLFHFVVYNLTETISCYKELYCLIPRSIKQFSQFSAIPHLTLRRHMMFTKLWSASDRFIHVNRSYVTTQIRYRKRIDEHK